MTDLTIIIPKREVITHQTKMDILDELDYQIKRDAKLIIETLCKNAVSMIDESIDTSIMLARRKV